MNLRHMEERDRAQVLEMMRVFYSSEAVMTNGSEEIFNNDISECVSESPFAEGFVFTDSDDVHLLGYAMLAHSFSTEYGVHCVWIEDIYLKEEARSKGLSSEFFDHLRSAYPGALHRLEAEHENLHAMEVYKRKGFEEMPYVELFRKPL
ncbi:MAG: GNAT family N-acetyltransferase [Mogibacterium sp.]|nr:GNAT family N-acetyltransferase [Mogibacterium sp.]